MDTTLGHFAVAEGTNFGTPRLCSNPSSARYSLCDCQRVTPNLRLSLDL